MPPPSYVCCVVKFKPLRETQIARKGNHNGGVILLPKGDDALDRSVVCRFLFSILIHISLHGKFDSTTSKRACSYTLKDETWQKITQKYGSNSQPL